MQKKEKKKINKKDRWMLLDLSQEVDSLPGDQLSILSGFN